MWFRKLCFFLLLASTSLCFGQKTAPAVDNDFVQKEFGSSCSLLAGSLPLRGDLNGDGIEDIVIPARCTNPLMDQAENNFRVVDPFYSYFGVGDTKITTEFASDVPERRSLVLLIIHGDGPDAWRSATPRAKFVVINLPYKEVQVKKLAFKKKTVMGIFVEEAGVDQTTSVLVWDGKRYRYQPLGSSLE